MEDNTPKNKGTRIAVNMNNYVKPAEIRPSDYIYNGCILNGINNNYYEELEKLVLGSPTTSAIITNIVTYTTGDGIVNNGVSLEEIIEHDDLENAVNDYYSTGQCALQVIYSKDRSVITRIKYVNIITIGIEEYSDLNDSPKGFFYCADFNAQGMNPITFVPAFGTNVDNVITYDKDGNIDNGVEILFLRTASRRNYNSLPTWQSAAQWASVEEELSNQAYNELANGFSASYMVTVPGVEDTIEAQEEARRMFQKNASGTSARGNIVFNFPDTSDNKATIEALPTTQLPDSYDVYSNKAKQAIFTAHGFYPILLGADEAGGGFGNNAQEMDTALRILMNKKIKPIRRKFETALTKVLKINDPSANVVFVDVTSNDTSNVTPVEDLGNNETQTNQI